MRNGFFGLVGTYDAEISGMAPQGNGHDWDEEYGVGPGNHWSALGQVMDFSSVGLLPEDAIRTGAELLLFGEFTSVGIKDIAMQSGVLDRVNRMALVGM